jgi:hypothetical protein
MTRNGGSDGVVYAYQLVGGATGTLTKLGTVKTTYFATGLFASATKLIVQYPDGVAGYIQLVDISNPASMSVTGSIAFDAYSASFAILGDYVYTNKSWQRGGGFFVFKMPSSVCNSWCQSSAMLEAATYVNAFCGQTQATSKTCGPSQKWCMRAKDVTPENGRAWGGSGTPEGIWGVRIVGASTANFSQLYVNGIAAAFTTADYNGTVRTAAWNHGFAPGSTHTITSCSNDGLMTLYADGVLVNNGDVLGTGLISAWSPTVTLGAYTGSREGNGYIGSIDFNTSGNPLDFPSAP